MGWPLRWLLLDAWTALRDAGDIAVEDFQRERQLIGIESLGAAAELRSLELYDDELETFDLAIAALDDAHHLAHELAQRVELYANAVNSPDTGKRISRPNPREDWRMIATPQLRILDEETWKRAQELKAQKAR